MVAGVGGGDNGDLGAVVNTIGTVGQLGDAGGKGGGIDAHQIGIPSHRVADIFPTMGHDGNVGAFHDAHAFKLLILHLGSEKAIDIYRCGIIRQVEIAVGCVGDIGDGAGDFVPHIVVDLRGEELRDGFAAAVAAGGAFEHHLAPSGVVDGEGQHGFGGEVGGEVNLGGAHGEGLLDGGVAVEGGFLIPVDEVVGRIRGGDNFHRGAGQDVVDVLLLGGKDAGGQVGSSALVAVDLNLGYAKLVKVGAVYVSMTTQQCCLEGGFLVEGRVHGQSLVVELDAGDGVVFAGGGDGKGYLIGVTIVPSPEVVVVIHAAAEGNGGDVVEGAAAALEGVVGLGAVDGGQQGLFRSACAKRQAAPLAVVAGEGEDGDLVEGGGEGGLGGGHGVGVAAAEAGVALDGLGLGAVAPLGEVAALPGRGGDAQLGAGQDAVGVSRGAGGHAVGGHGDDAGRVDGDLINLDITGVAAGETHAGGVDVGDAAVAFRTASVADDGAGGAADCRDDVMAIGHVELDAGDVLAVCRGDGDGLVVSNLNAIAVANMGAGDGEVLAGVGVQTLVGGEALALLLGVVRHAVELNAALAVGGEGEEGVLGEGGGEGHAPADGDGVGVGGVVLGLAVVAPGADVVAVLGLGHGLHGGAGDDEVLAFGRAGDDAVADGGGGIVDGKTTFLKGIECVFCQVS